MVNFMKYAEKIKKLRNKLIMSQDEFAKLLGVSLATVNRWEKGHHEPTIKQKRVLNKLFLENGMEE